MIRISCTLPRGQLLVIDANIVADADTVANSTNFIAILTNGHNSGPVMISRYGLQPIHTHPQTRFPTGEILPVAEPYGFTKMKPIGQDIEAGIWGSDPGHGWRPQLGIKTTSRRSGIAGKAKIQQAVAMEAYTDLPGTGLYCKLLKRWVPLKRRCPLFYDRRHAFCFETQYYPDACHKPNFRHRS